MKDKKNAFEYGSLVVLSLLIVVLSSIIAFQKTKIQKRNDTSNMITQQQAIGILLSTHLYNNIWLKPEMLRNEKWESLNLGIDFFRYSSFKVCLWFPEELCTSCYSEELESFKHFSDKIGYDKTAIITNSQNPRIVGAFKKANKLRCPVLSLIDQNILINKIENPVLFLLNPGYRIDNPVVLIPGAKNLIASFFGFALQLCDSTSNYS